MTAQTAQMVNKETQKIVLRALFEAPSTTPEELTLTLNSQAKNLSQEEIFQVLNLILPENNWYRITKENTHKEILSYVWTLEFQVLFLLPAKQKENTIAEFNQVRLQNNQTKVSKDLIRHIQSLLQVDSKNLSKFRKFVKDLSFQNDIDPNTQTEWMLRVLLAELDMNSISTFEDLSKTLIDQLKEKSPVIFEKAGKTVFRLSERFAEKYFPKDASADLLRELVRCYQDTYHRYATGVHSEIQHHGESRDYNMLIQEIVRYLNESKNLLVSSHEGGFFSKLISGKVKNKEGILEKIDDAVKLINQLGDLNNKSNKTVSEKVLLLKKVQSDYENVVLTKNQLEKDLFSLREKTDMLEEKNNSMQNEVREKTEQMNKALEKLSSLEEKSSQVPDLESKVSLLRNDLNFSREISVRLYSRVKKLKTDLLTNLDKVKETSASNGSYKVCQINSPSQESFVVRLDSTVQQNPDQSVISETN